MKNIGKPCTGKPYARFDEGGQALPVLYSTLYWYHKVSLSSGIGALFGGSGALAGQIVSKGANAFGSSVASYSWRKAPLYIRLMATSNAITGIVENNAFTTFGSTIGNVLSNVIANSNQ
jgi:hypothetical protein